MIFNTVHSTETMILDKIKAAMRVNEHKKTSARSEWVRSATKTH
jgi:hypothetical protein